MLKDLNISRKDWILAGILVLVAAGSLLTMMGPTPKPVIFGAPAQAGLVLFSGGSPGSQVGQFNYPRGVAIDEQGDLYVADSRNHRIQKFRGTDGKFLEDFGGFLKVEGDPDALKGNGPGKLNEPNDVACGPGEEVAVADTWNHRIQVFNTRGRFKRVVVSEDGFFAPRGVAMDADGNIFVADTGRHRVFKFDNKGKKVRMWGVKGAKTGEFNEPIGLALDQAGNLYVADRLNFRIQVFSNAGDYLRTFPVQGWSPEQIDMEPHMAIDKRRGVLFVTDGRGKKLMRYKLEGESLGPLEKDATGVPLFAVPLGVAVGPDGGVLVSDAGSGRLLKLRAE
jgi:DNA-binding beta-propeller fold protein YncE